MKKTCLVIVRKRRRIRRKKFPPVHHAPKFQSFVQLTVETHTRVFFFDMQIKLTQELILQNEDHYKGVSHAAYGYKDSPMYAQIENCVQSAIIA
jgi:hypothetical protein